MYGPIYKQSNDYQDLKQLFVIFPMHYGFKEYFYKQKKQGKIRILCSNFLWKSLDIRISGS